jgi:hypothetical protein
MDHPPYSPDFDPAIVYISAIQHSMTLLQGIPENDFQNHFWQ